MSHQLSDPRLPCRRDLCRKRSYNFMMTESPAWPCGTLAMLLLGEPRLLVVRGPLRPGFLGSSASEVLGCRQQVFRLWWLTATTISRRVRPPQHELRQSTQSKTWGGGRRHAKNCYDECMSTSHRLPCSRVAGMAACHSVF